jgi:hypothetical protein
MYTYDEMEMPFEEEITVERVKRNLESAKW